MWLRASLSNLPLIICASLASLPVSHRHVWGHPSPSPLFLFPGSTALHLATISCQPQCVKVLLQVRATPRYYSCERKKWTQRLLCLEVTSNTWSNVPLSSPISELVILYSLIHEHVFNSCCVQAPWFMLSLGAGHPAEDPGWAWLSVTTYILSSAKTNCCDDGQAEEGGGFPINPKSYYLFLRNW